MLLPGEKLVFRGELANLLLFHNSRKKIWLKAAEAIHARVERRMAERFGGERDLMARWLQTDPKPATTIIPN